MRDSICRKGGLLLTIEEIQCLNRNDKVIYKGKLWKYKNYGTIGRGYKVKIQRGNEIFYLAMPEELSLPDKGDADK